MASYKQFIDSKYLKQEDVGETGVLATLRSIERKDVSAKDEPPQFKAVAYFAELEKPLVLNSTNLQLMAQIAGSDDTDEWIGKLFVLYVDPTISYNNKLVGGIRIRKPKPGAKPKPAPEPPPADDDDIPF